MNTKSDGKNIVIRNVGDFDLGQTLKCGQCFHFDEVCPCEYVISAYDRILRVRQEGDDVIFFDTDEAEREKIWIPYFDLERDYSAIKEYLIENDEKMEEVIKANPGIRILNQEFHETLISFIISQNNQIPHIKNTVSAISARFGRYLGRIGEKDYYSFPDIDTLGKISEAEYRELKTGFRAPYLCDASWRLNFDPVLRRMASHGVKGMSEEESRSILKSIKGVGDKVANCVMLFSLGYRSSFPIDVWIKRSMEERYFYGNKANNDEIMALAVSRFGSFGGYAQQYIFAYGRANKLGKNKNNNEM